LLAWLRRRAARMTRPSLCDDLVGETLVVLVRQFQAGRPVRSWIGLARIVLATRLARHGRAARRSLGQESCDCDLLPSPSVEEPSEPVRQPVPRLRGSLERALVAGVMNGQDCADLAAVLGKSTKELRRVARTVAAKLRAGEDPQGNSHREHLSG